MMDDQGPVGAGTELTHDRVVSVAGELTDAKVARIIAVGATIEELEQAVAFAAGEDDVMGEARLPAAGRVAEIYDILTLEEEFGEEEGREEGA
jgi:hypothetical protein